jgi:hypothetical protein
MLGVGILLKLGMAKLVRMPLALVTEQLLAKLCSETPTSWQISFPDVPRGQHKIFRNHFKNR